VCTAQRCDCGALWESVHSALDILTKCRGDDERGDNDGHD
jgi:hypothetical protein